MEVKHGQIDSGDFTEAFSRTLTRCQPSGYNVPLDW
jgi:hypothetical protein